MTWTNPFWQRLLMWALRHPSPSLMRVPTFMEALLGVTRMGTPPTWRETFADWRRQR